MERKIILSVTLLVGAMDTLTGLLLMFLPEITIGLMGITIPYTDWIFIRFVGAFVFGVGSTYLIGFISSTVFNNWNELRSIWKITAWIRFSICVFTSITIIGGWIDPAWIGVPLTDGAFAVFQWYWVFLRRFPMQK